MCGRFTHMHTWPEVPSFLSLELLRGPASEALFGPHYNVAPPQIVPVARVGADGVPEIVPMRWGLLPSWAKDTKRAPINARAETVQESGMFRNALSRAPAQPQSPMRPRTRRLPETYLDRSPRYGPRRLRSVRGLRLRQAVRDLLGAELRLPHGSSSEL